MRKSSACAWGGRSSLIERPSPSGVILVEPSWWRRSTVLDLTAVTVMMPPRVGLRGQQQSSEFDDRDDGDVANSAFQSITTNGSQKERA
jgi:hypothetical protein